MLSFEDGLRDGIIKKQANSVRLGVDSVNLAPDGRSSMRVETWKRFNGGLFVFDIAHMPGSICGTWPALWSLGPSWPSR